MFSPHKSILILFSLSVVTFSLESSSAGREKTPRRTRATAAPSQITPTVHSPSSVSNAATSETSALSTAISDPAEAPAASSTVIRNMMLGIPKIHRHHDGPNSSRFGGWWCQFTDTFAGSPPTSKGVVIPTVQLQGVYLGSDFSTTDSASVTTLETYLSFLATSTYLTELQAPYGVSSGTSVQGKVISASLPQFASTSTYLLDSDIVGYLATNINNGTLTPATSSTVYVVYVAPGVAVDAGGGSTSMTTFLGYHNTAQFTATGGATTTMYYAVIPFPGSPNPTYESQGFSSLTDELTAVTSHEVAEAVTDPDTANGWQETVHETFALQIFNWTVFSYTIDLTGEEIGDVTLLLNNSGPQCYARYTANTFLVQQLIAADGVTMLTPGGATELTATSTDGDADTDDGVSVMGVRFRFR